MVCFLVPTARGVVPRFFVTCFQSACVCTFATQAGSCCPLVLLWCVHLCYTRVIALHVSQMCATCGHTLMCAGMHVL
jgi:hypothetical protein